MNARELSERAKEPTLRELRMDGAALCGLSIGRDMCLLRLCLCRPAGPQHSVGQGCKTAPTRERHLATICQHREVCEAITRIRRCGNLYTVLEDSEPRLAKTLCVCVCVPRLCLLRATSICA